jgi:hypothetical protein
MKRVSRTALILAAAIVVSAASDAAAQPPGPATGLVARDGKSVGFSWPAVSGATWYYLWINDSSNTTRHQKWYQAHELDCAVGQALTCKIGLTLDASHGVLTWWVQTWSSGGFGPWTPAQVFAPGPHVALVSANGTLLRGNAASATRLATGSYEVIFNRNVTGCVYNVNVGGTQFDSPLGFASATRRSGDSFGIFVFTADTSGADADRPFHLTVHCGTWPVGVG